MRLDAVVGRLVRDLECELQGIACAQDDGVWTFLEGNTVRMSNSAWVNAIRVKSRTPLNEVYPRRVQQRSTWVIEGRVGQHVQLR
jgi:hypothetical protein